MHSNKDHIILQTVQCNRRKSPDRDPYAKTWNLTGNALWVTGGKLSTYEWC